MPINCDSCECQIGDEEIQVYLRKNSLRLEQHWYFCSEKCLRTWLNKRRRGRENG